MVLVKKYRDRKRKNKGQIFLIEMFMSILLIVIVLSLMFEMQQLTTITSQHDLTTDLFNILYSMDKSGELENHVLYMNQTGDSSKFYDALITKVPVGTILKFSLFRKGSASAGDWIKVTGFNENTFPETSDNVASVDYIMSGVNNTLQVYKIHVEAWQGGF